MPELPEVETIRRGLKPFLENRSIIACQVNRHDLRKTIPKNFAGRVKGRTVRTLERRGKVMIWKTDRDAIIMHLGMSGRLRINSKPDKHDHLVLCTDHDDRIAFNDPRRFGWISLISDSCDYITHKSLADLGPEPWVLTVDDFKAHERRRSRTLKSALLDQTLVAGIGNIYASEALHLSKLSPYQPSTKLRRKEIRRLIRAICVTLDAAIVAGGSTLRDYRQVGGEIGYFQHSWRVYGQDGKACPACREKIIKTSLSGRATYFCPRCQRVDGTGDQRK